jgi:branched-chain amino acid transport system permease protein
MRSKMSSQTIAICALLGVMALLPVAATWFDQGFYIDLGSRVLIFAIAALSLDLILGYGGMISLGHAAYLGIGAYSVGILSYHGIHNGFVHLAVAISASAFAAFLIGASSVRTTGIQFIMITLAFGQMLFYLAISINTYGGDDGLTIRHHSDFGRLLSLGNPANLYYVCFGTFIAVLMLLHRIVGSRFGVVLQAIKSNEPRARAIGVPIYRYKLTAFVISAVICGIAGVLLANQNLFISPASMHWSRSSEILIMTILGGMGTLSGGLLGAMLYVCLEYFLSQATEHWPVIFGPIVIVFVLFIGRGVMGLVPTRQGATV